MSKHLRAKPARVALAAGLVGALAAGLSCGGEPTGPSVTSVSVTSPIGAVMAAGRTVQLSAVARSVRGDVPGVTILWTSSNTGVATVNASGLVTGVAAGFSTITAEAQGTGVSGTLNMQVVVVNLNAIDAALNDPFTTALVTNLTTSVRTPMQAALQQCDAAVPTGNLLSLDDCLVDAKALLPGTDATDRALLAVLSLILDYAERLLGI